MPDINTADKPTTKRRAKSLAALTAGAIAATGFVAATATPAQAYVRSCTRTDCTIYFSKSETRAIAQGRIPPLPFGADRVVRIYQWGARIAASRGQCTAFTVTLVPWHNNGYYPYNCNWA